MNSTRRKCRRWRRSLIATAGMKRRRGARASRVPVAEMLSKDCGSRCLVKKRLPTLRMPTKSFSEFRKSLSDKAQAGANREHGLEVSHDRRRSHRRAGAQDHRSGTGGGALRSHPAGRRTDRRVPDTFEGACSRAGGPHGPDGGGRQDGASLRRGSGRYRGGHEDGRGSRPRRGAPPRAPAAAVAADMAVVTLGSDTGGSIRQPASFCGVVGLMPTYGRVSRYGLIAFASSLDHIGPLSNTVKDAATVLRTIAGRDPMDSTSADVPVPDYVAELEKPVRGLKLGVAKEYFGDGLDDEVRHAVESAIDKLKTLGCEVVPVSLPHTPYAIPTYYLIATRLE